MQEVVYRHPEQVRAVVFVGTTSTRKPIARWERWALQSSSWWLRLSPDHDLRPRIVRSTARSAPAWAAHEPRCRYEVIPDADQDNPAAFNRILLEFLAEQHATNGGEGPVRPPGAPSPR